MDLLIIFTLSDREKQLKCFTLNRPQDYSKQARVTFNFGLKSQLIDGFIYFTVAEIKLLCKYYMKSFLEFCNLGNPTFLSFDTLILDVKCPK